MRHTTRSSPVVHNTNSPRVVKGVRLREPYALILAMALSSLGAAVAQAQVNIATQHNDNSRSGANLRETFLTPTNVSSGNFGKLYELAVDGQVYAQPLYVSDLVFQGREKHNVVFVATMNNSVYAFDADIPGRLHWKASFGTPVTPSDVESNNNISENGKVGILGTPVIDLTTNTMYFVSRNEKISGLTKTFSQFVNAIDITTGSPKFGSPRQITATYTTADGTLTFDPRIHNQRPAMTLANGNVYIAWASHDDEGLYHGWVMAYSASKLAQVGVYSDTTLGTNGNRGGIWQAGQGLTVDASGNLMFSSGNGSFGTSPKGVTQTGNSFVKLSPTLKLLDYFTPYNSASLNAGDMDLGASGLLGIPKTNFIVSGGKAGVLYLVNSNNMGHFNASQDKIQQEFRAIYGTGSQHIHGAPVYLDSANSGPMIYVWGENDYLRAFSYNTSTNLLDATPSATSSMKAPMTNNNGAMPGGFLSISANGTKNGIVWASTPYSGNALGATVRGVLHAFDASSLAELWTDKADDARDDVGNFAKYVPVTIANGKVFVSTFGDNKSKDGSGNLNVYGLLTLIPNGEYTIKNVNSGLLLDVPGQSTREDVTLDQAGASGSESQTWKVTNLGGNLVTLTNVHSDMDVDNSNNSLAAQSPIIQWPSNNGNNQKWQVTQVGSGTYTLTNQRSGLLLDVTGASKSAGTLMDQYWSNAGTNQQWIFQAK